MESNVWARILEHVRRRSDDCFEECRILLLQSINFIIARVF
jgi:hypothetical protein